MTFEYGASSADPEAWHEERRGMVTASEIAHLAHSGKAGWASLKAEKAGGDRWAGNQHTRWGHEREPIIAERMSRKYPWLKPNDRVVSQSADPRWGATPDMIGESHSMLCQIKTAKLTGKPWSEPPPTYYDQCLWELWVTGFDTNVLVVEYYEDDPVFQFRVADPDLYEFEITRDEARIAELVEVAESFLAMGDPSPFDLYLADYARGEELERSGAEIKAAARELIEKEIGDRAAFKFVSDAGSISLTTPKPSKRFDAKALEADDPDLYGRYVKESQGKPRLTIRPEGVA